MINCWQKFVVQRSLDMVECRWLGIQLCSASLWIRQLCCWLVVLPSPRSEVVAGQELDVDWSAAVCRRLLLWVDWRGLGCTSFYSVSGMLGGMVIDAYERNFVFVEASNFLECLMEVVIDAYERNFVFVEASNFLECLAPFRSMYFNGGGVFRPFWFHSTGRGVPPEFSIMTAGACRLGFGNVVCCCGIFSNVSMTMTTTRFLHGSPVSVNDVCDFVGILMCWSLLTRWRRCLSGCAGESCLNSGSCVACRSKSCSLPGCLFWASCVGSEGL
ncbi:uncharacterized protein LOC143918404 [Arctopsyche grandis]|uniref:uncharacterized protein LOC143918404 n=1 Tax=Arctopsyche grandis TaxID=121162 RepID=UPI00406D98ED